METVPPRTAESFADYREFVRRELMPPALRIAVPCGLAIVLGFIPLDAIAEPQMWRVFAPIRVATAGVMGGLYWAFRSRAPEVASIGMGLSIGMMLVAISAFTGAGTSPYYSGLVLLFGAFPVIIPVTIRQTVLVCGATSLCFFLMVAVGSDGTGSTTVVFHGLVLSSAFILAVASSVNLEKIRYSDFSKRRELECARDRLEDLDRAKSRFTANIHHELRTPLTLMLAPIEAMRSGDMGDIPSGLDRTLRTMQSNGLRLLKLINGLLDLAKIESEQLSVRRVPIELRRLVADIVDGALPMAERKGLHLRAEGFDGLPTANVDPDALEKVLVNLIGNALKFTDSGGITVRGAPAAAGDGRGLDAEGVHIVVEDTGVGIPEHQLARVFDRFAQVDGSATRKHEGTGIGLSLVQELVALHGGRVWATSEGDGHGSQMHVLLPLGEADDDPEEEVLLEAGGNRALSAAKSFEALASETSMDLEHAGEGRFAAVEHTVSRWEATRHGDEWVFELPEHAEGTPEIVIAEDNAEMRRLLAFLLGREFRVRPTRNGLEALEAVREQAPELVVTDVMMPEMSGTELCRAIKQDGALRGVPVMLVTSKAEREMKIEGLELGADDYVTKPFHPRELLARARSLVRIRSLQLELREQNAALESSNAELAQALEELKEAEVQLVQAERLAAVGELSAGVAHEVNNPLNFARNSLAALRAYADDIQGLVSWVGELDADDPQTLRVQLLQLERKKREMGFEDMASELAELVGIVTEGLDRTARLVADLRDFAAPGRSGHAIVDVGAGLRSTLQLLGHQLREAGIATEVEIAADLPAVFGDPGGLNQVFLNLLKNAIEAFEGEEGTISVQAKRVDGELEVRVADTGSGIEADVQSRLFEPFFTTKQAGQGTGLGLAMSDRIVREHGGRIELASTPGEGTRVTVVLPVDAEGADAG